MEEKIIIYSGKDPAGTNIVRLLDGSIPAQKITLLEESVLYIDSLEKDCDLCIVASRHKSVSETPTLTVHSPGNFHSNDLGGNQKELGFAPALYLKEALMCLKLEKENLELDFEVCFEATHHGPTSLPMPVMFVEVGSSPEQWENKTACTAASNAIEHIFENPAETADTAIAFGGGHYARKFSAVEEYAIGHICPKYNLENIDKAMVVQMIEKTYPLPETALVEKRGLGKEKHRIFSILEELNLDVVKL